MFMCVLLSISVIYHAVENGTRLSPHQGFYDLMIRGNVFEVLLFGLIVFMLALRELAFGIEFRSKFNNG